MLLGVIFSPFVKWQFHNILIVHHSSSHFCLSSSHRTHVVVLLCPRYNRKKIVPLTCRSIFLTEAIQILKSCQYNQSERVRPSGLQWEEGTEVGCMADREKENI